MRIGVMSDTHGEAAAAQRILPQLGEIGLLLHAGDHYTDAQSIGQGQKFPVQAVRGNCDYFTEGPGQLLLECAGKKLLLLHGHQFNVKRGYAGIIAYAKTVKPDLVVFGHTHIPAVFNAEGMVFVNPGSLFFPRGLASPSYGIIEITNNQVLPSLYTVSRGRRPILTDED